MHITSIPILVVGLAWLWALLPPAAARAAEPAKLTVAKKAPPAELADGIRSVLSPTAVQLTEGDAPFFEFWFRKEIPLTKKPAADSYALTAVKGGMVLGAVRVYEERYDFKDEEILPGVYVMRFSLQPEDGDHLGTSPSRTFVLLVPAKDDQQLDAFSDYDDLVEASSTINAAEHPSNLNLQAVKDTSGEFPRLASHRDGDHKVLYLRVPAKAEGSADRITLTLALVYDGMGEI